MTPEHIEELYETEMDAESKNLWLACRDWLVSYFGCSKQLADIRIREWNDEYQHNPMKTVGLTQINHSKKAPVIEQNYNSKIKTINWCKGIEV